MLIYNKINKQIIEGTKIGETKYTIKVETPKGVIFTLKKSDILIQPEMLDDPKQSRLILDSLESIRRSTDLIEQLEKELERIMLVVN
jgi:hypothetical protein